MKMPIWFKIVWMIPILINVAALVWFILGSTSGFQRGQDLIETVTFVFFGGPSLIIILLSLICIWHGWSPFNLLKYLIAVVMMIPLIFCAYYLVEGTPNRGWLYDDIRSDPVRLTSDHKYEYRIDLINPFQRNSREQLHLKDVSTGKEMNIPIVLRKNREPYLSGSGDDWAWAILKPSEVPYKYKLSTLEEDNVESYNMDPRVYLIDVEAGTAQIVK